MCLDCLETTTAAASSPAPRPTACGKIIFPDAKKIADSYDTVTIDNSQCLHLIRSKEISLLLFVETMGLIWCFVPPSLLGLGLR